jgi:hypothetical protein
VAGAITWVAFVAERPVPGLDWIDLGIHELGHMVTFWLPRLLYFMAGSFFQIAFPLTFALYFWFKQRDFAGTGLCLAWAGTSAWDVSVYIADAPYQALPLVGGGTHDWGYILGPEQFDALDRAGSIAGFVETTGLVAAVVGTGLALWPALTWVTWRVSGRSRRPDPPVRSRALVVDVEPPAPQAPPIRAATSAATPADPWLEAAQLPFYHGGEAGTEQ